MLMQLLMLSAVGYSPPPQISTDLEWSRSVEQIPESSHIRLQVSWGLRLSWVLVNASFDSVGLLGSNSIQLGVRT